LPEDDITGFTKQINRMARIGATPTFLTAAGDGQVKIINGESGASNRTLQAGNDFVYAVVANGDSSVVAAGGEDGVVRLFDGKTGRALRELAPPKAP
jgi:WD40 repeat protein